MNKNKIVKYIDKLLLILLIVSLFIIFLDRIIKPDKFITYLVSIFLFLVSIFFKPFIDKLKEEPFGKRGKNILFFQSIISIVFIISSYRVFISRDLNIELDFYFFIASFILLILMCVYIEGYNDIEGKKTFNISWKEFLKPIIWIGIFIISFLSIYDSKEVVYLKDLKKPNKIAIVKKEGKNNDTFKGKYKEVKEKEIIEGIYKQLYGQEVENIRNMEKIRYIKFTDNKSYYLILPDYGEKNKDGLKNGYFDFIRIYPEGYITIEEFGKNNGVFKSYVKSYKAHLSKELIDKIQINYNKK
ncbi:hypothetical protein BD780_001375 [Clostridium tetanomorphum]|uniref:Uncharacterized protein n=1 Tax=Clostridium tetanomorphum TaxID=1553 RepID=A0A923J0A3_CLOTT|nr:hypothetical protein [Clostridium tetanomorphum]KAJ49558.1 hypothetical protein CTM_22506 [Clostridium tetanomorphum DSM 665]KAJ53905.1 hypothetical protein CTM_00035 [Clostridium tetanomorphum DSM 665]MBC2398111.1 hypothetical protein [Clostridium tetanomorphum]MBP1864680.1 hypothetical protein [Clostridium tetanomorphum]NRS84150.1 hypothetical protein [Clostridium tetanomorphum]